MNIGDTLLKEFNELPDRAKSLWFEWLWETAMRDSCDTIMFLTEYGFTTEGCKSPIEQIFQFAFSMYRFCNYDGDFDDGLCLESQFRIETINGKTYIADFVLHHEFAKFGSPYLVIECDGHDYHNATKEQVAHDNERDFDIKESGYDILHFSGSQLFKSPMKCAEKAYKYFKFITTLNDYSEGVFSENGRKTDADKEDH
jgi:very-short-patch-repair endonuclease